MKATSIGLGMCAMAGLCFLAAAITHSGLGSCGPYGPVGGLVIVGMLLLLLGIVVLAAYRGYRGVKLLRR
jgi:hypothetical protein